jgi:hypothetical protein
VLTRQTIRFQEWLGKPISRFWRLLSWIISTGLFIGFAGLLGGPTDGDASETVYSTWSVAHGNVGCSYPVITHLHLDNLADPFALAAPVYPLFSGALAALLRIGHGASFPTQSQLGSSCTHAFVEMFKWSEYSDAFLPTVRLAYFVWPLLLAGTVLLLRAAGVGRTRWEGLGAVLIACTPPVLMCVTFYFHPEDVMAMGLCLAALAMFLEKRWVWAGVLVGVAICTQQFTLLVAIPLFVVALCAIALIDVPMVVLTSGRAMRVILFGSSRAGTVIRSAGGTVLWELNLHGIILFTISRLLPLLASAILAWYVSRRLGSKILSPVPLISLFATSLIFRLVFEINLFGYYFMATAVALILLEIASRRMRGTVLAWLALFTVAFNPVHVGFISNMKPWSLTLANVIPIALFIVVALSVLYDALIGRMRLYKYAWLVIVALTGESKLWGLHRAFISIPTYGWQIILVPLALWLAIGPLKERIKTTEPTEKRSIELTS